LHEFLETESARFPCPGCGRMIDGSELRVDERFKCAKCKKMLRFGPRLFDPLYARAWQAGRSVLVVGCMGALVWCGTLGYGFGARTGRWAEGLGGGMAVWAVAAGCIALAARTTQNNGVVVGVAAMMAGAALFFIERLGRELGYDVAAWSRFRFHAWWVPGLVAVGAAVLAASLVLQVRRRSL